MDPWASLYFPSPFTLRFIFYSSSSLSWLFYWENRHNKKKLSICSQAYCIYSYILCFTIEGQFCNGLASFKHFAPLAVSLSTGFFLSAKNFLKPASHSSVPLQTKTSWFTLYSLRSHPLVTVLNPLQSDIHSHHPSSTSHEGHWE